MKAYTVTPTENVLALRRKSKLPSECDNDEGEARAHVAAPRTPSSKPIRCAVCRYGGISEM